LGIALVLGQALKLHMHIQHDGIPSLTTGHVVVVHTAISHHDITYDLQHQEDPQAHHHLAEIDMSPDSATAKVVSFNPFMLLFLIACIFLCAPQLRYIRRWFALSTKPVSLYYLFYPPLRAPPGSSAA
jgi:hypothetical protein